MASGRKSGSVVWSYFKFAESNNKVHCKGDPEMVEDDIFTLRFIRRQLAAYAAENQLTQTADPLHWWQANEAKFCSLTVLARKYLTTPATSAPSERVFSLAGNICRPVTYSTIGSQSPSAYYRLLH